jgi:hypothetical protein
MLDRRVACLGLVFLGLGSFLTGCKIVPLSEVGAGAAAAFDAQAYAAGLWSRLCRTLQLALTRPSR